MKAKNFGYRIGSYVFRGMDTAVCEQGTQVPSPSKPCCFPSCAFPTSTAWTHLRGSTVLSAVILKIGNPQHFRKGCAPECSKFSTTDLDIISLSCACAPSVLCFVLFFLSRLRGAAVQWVRIQPVGQLDLVPKPVAHAVILGKLPEHRGDFLNCKRRLIIMLSSWSGCEGCTRAREASHGAWLQMRGREGWTEWLHISASQRGHTSESPGEFKKHPCVENTRPQRFWFDWLRRSLGIRTF